MEATGIMQSRKFSNMPISLPSKSDAHFTFSESSSVRWPTINANIKRMFCESVGCNNQEAELAVLARETNILHQPYFQECEQIPKRLRSEDSMMSSSLKERDCFALDSMDDMQPPEKELRVLVSSKGSTFFRHSASNGSWMLQQPPSPCSYNPLDEPSPLGLRLKKSPSLLELVSMSVAQGSINPGLAVKSISMEVTQGFIKNKDSTVLIHDKLKASNFPASVLKIGNWECYSRYEGDLVAKCYYAKRKLVWEVLENGLKSKIEIQWSDITAIKACYPENEHGTLEIEVSRTPLFFRELNPQPRKHTLWQSTSDFTGGEATVSRRHHLRFLEGVLNRHYEKLLQCDPRLKALSNGITTGTDGVLIPSQFHVPETSHQILKCETSLTFTHDHVQDQSLLSQSSTKTDETSTCALLIPKVEQVVQSIFTPPSSVIDTRGSEETGSSDGDFCVKEEYSSDVHSEVFNLVPAHGALENFEHESLPHAFRCIEDEIRHFDRNVLDEISQALLGEPLSIFSQEEAIVLTTRVQAMSASLSQYAQHITPLPTSEEISLNDFPELYTNTCFPKGLKVEELQYGIGGDTDDVKPFRHNNFKWELSALENNLNLSKPWMRDDSSAGDLLANLPRIASLPQFFDSQREMPF